MSAWRVKPLPPNWQATKRRVLRRDKHVCYVCGRGGANAVDHIVPVCEGGGDEDSNLAAIHAYPCHARKTAAEANRHNAKATPRKRKPEKHPGSLV